ncbi:MAG: hypothetical protein ACOYMR_09075, partial [Ilumatobacteraceae bacterium]
EVVARTSLKEWNMGLGNLAEKQFQKNLELAQSAISEPVISAAIFQRSGSFGAGLMGGVSQSAAFGMDRDGKKKAGGFPADSLLAVTATHLYAFEVKGGLKFKIKAPVGSWERSAVGVEAEDGKATVQVKFDFGEDGVAVLETQKVAAHAGNLHFVREVAGGGVS